MVTFTYHTCRFFCQSSRNCSLTVLAHILFPTLFPLLPLLLLLLRLLLSHFSCSFCPRSIATFPQFSFSGSMYHCRFCTFYLLLCAMHLSTSCVLHTNFLQCFNIFHLRFLVRLLQRVGVFLIFHLFHSQLTTSSFQFQTHDQQLPSSSLHLIFYFLSAPTPRRPLPTPRPPGAATATNAIVAIADAMASSAVVVTAWCFCHEPPPPRLKSILTLNRRVKTQLHTHASNNQPRKSSFSQEKTLDQFATQCHP